MFQPAQNRYDNRDIQNAGSNNQQGQRNNSNRNPRTAPPRLPRQDSARSGPGRNSLNDDGNFGKEHF